MKTNSQKGSYYLLTYTSSVATNNFDAGKPCWFYSVLLERVLCSNSDLLLLRD